MKKRLFFLLFFFTCSLVNSDLMAQGIEDLVINRNINAFEKKITLERKPAKLPGVREADVTWSKIVWRMIDLREKMNQHLYFPTVEIQGRMNLVNVLLKAIKDEALIAFDPPMNDENEFAVPIGYDQIKARLGSGVKNVSRRNFSTGQLQDTTILLDMRTDQVQQLIVKEIWYFDKQKSTLQVRVLGLCPIRLYYKNEEKKEDLARDKLFWVYYPETRKLLAKNEVLNSRNGARNLSFDDIFLMRNFDGYILKEENVYDNRAIMQYASEEYALRESERIKNAIFNYEQDLWEY